MDNIYADCYGKEFREWFNLNDKTYKIYLYKTDVGFVADEIGDYLVKWGRIGVRQTKEKYGTCRVYCGFGWYSLHSIIFPRWVYLHARYPKWLNWFDSTKVNSFIFSIVNKIIILYQIFIYRQGYKRVLKYINNPDMRRNIINYADFTEYLKGL